MSNQSNNRSGTEDVSLNSCSGDINDIFDLISFSENKIVSNGYEEGFEKGKAIGELEGYHLGYHRGAELGAELGFYKGVIDALTQVLDESLLLRHQRTIEKLNTLLHSFPRFNDEHLDIVSMKDNIRSTFKKLCSLLKIEIRSSENSSIVF